MKNVMRALCVVLLGLTLIMTTGCAKKQVKSGYSGFLTNYPQFKPGPEGGAKEVYFKEGVDFSRYKKVMMDQVVFYLSDDAEYKGIQPDTLKELSDSFHAAAFEALKDAYPIVDKPGPDVIRIRSAITELVPAKPGLTLATTAMPGGSALKVVKYAATGSHSFAGKTSMEAEMLDSMSGERIAAVIDDGGEEQKLKLEVSTLTEGMTKWGDVKDVFEFWAERLRQWLDKTHGVEKGP